MRRRWSRVGLGGRIALIAVAGALVAAIVALVVATGLVRDAEQRQTRVVLAHQADLVSELATAAKSPQLAQRPIRALREENIPTARVLPDGTLRGDSLARLAAAARPTSVLQSRSLSYEAKVDGHEVFVESRPLGNGSAIVLAQRVRTADAAVRSLVVRLLWGLLAGLAIALVFALLLGRRVAAPLRAAADAAAELAAGRRDLQVQPSGPPEVAEVAHGLNTLRDALTSSEDRQRQFLLSVSHELRTPLTAIKGYAEALADGVSTGSDAATSGAVISEESARLERLVRDLLDLARLGADDFRIETAPVDLVELVRRAAAVWATRCSAVGVELRTELAPGEIDLLTDPTRVRQLLDGLAENALRVTPAGAPIIFAVRRDGQGARMEVRDGGPGLTPDDCAVAFERSVLYERYRGVRQVGTGVGLALAGALAERLGGSAHAGRAPEGGAAFLIRLPASVTVMPHG